MNNKITYTATALMFLLAFAPSGKLMAQSQDQIDKFNEERKVYFTEELELTESGVHSILVRVRRKLRECVQGRVDA